VNRIATTQNVDAARNSDRAKATAKAEDFVRWSTYEDDCKKARTSWKCKLELQL